MYEAELKRIRHIPTENLNAYETLLRGMENYYGSGKLGNAQARQIFEKAIELDPGYSMAYAFLANTYWREWLSGWSQDSRTIEQAFELAQKALELDESSIYAYEALGYIYLWKDRNHEEAIAASEKVIALDPNYAGGYGVLAETLKFAGRPEEVIELMEKAMRINPSWTAYYLFQSGSSYYYMGRYDEALKLLIKAAHSMRNHYPTRAYLASIYTELGREEEAKAELAEVLRINPKYSLKETAKYPYKNPAYLERVRDHIRRAGLK